MDEGTTKQTNWRNTRTPRVSQEVVDLRVTAVYRWMTEGKRPRDIQTLVRASAMNEAKKRREARAGNKPLPRFVWGDIDPPCSERQVENYIRKAKDRLEAEGRELTKSAAGVLGLTWARMQDLYYRALEDKRYTVCRNLLKDTREMFGLNGAIKLQLIPPGMSDPNAPPADMRDLPETSMTEEQMSAEWVKLASVALGRLRERGGLPALRSGPALVGEPIATIEPEREDDSE